SASTWKSRSMIAFSRHAEHDVGCVDWKKACRAIGSPSALRTAWKVPGITSRLTPFSRTETSGPGRTRILREAATLPKTADSIDAAAGSGMAAVDGRAGVVSPGRLPDTRGVEHLAERLAAIPGVVAVTLGGSRATGTAVEGSDWDFGLYYRGGLNPADITALGWPGRVFAPGEWGSIVNGGAGVTGGGTQGGLLYPELGEGLRSAAGRPGRRVRDPPPV